MGKLNSYQNSKAQYKSNIDLLAYEFNERNQHAFRYIFESYYKAAVLFAREILKEQAFEAEDLVQDAFIKLWSQAENFNALAAIKSYIYTTVKNACLDKLRKGLLTNKYQGHAKKQLEMLEAEFIEPLITAETTRIIYEAIDKLPEQGRNVFRMSLEGLKNDEIAERLNISVNTVKTHKQRALTSLRVYIGDALFLFILLNHEHWLK